MHQHTSKTSNQKLVICLCCYDSEALFQGSSKCGPCPFGYSGDGKVCIRTASTTNQCDNPSVCHPLATCTQSELGVSCTCPARYSGNGFGPFGCIESILAPNGCSPNPCLNNGICTNNGAFGYRCVCPVGTVQPRCARANNLCSPNPCQNGGICMSGSFQRYRCVCPPHRTGRFCQLEARLCGGVLNSLNGTLKYTLDANYPHNAVCAWLIKTNDDKVLNVTFIRFDVELSVECRYDWLQIHDGRSSASHVIGRYILNKITEFPNEILLISIPWLNIRQILWQWTTKKWKYGFDTKYAIPMVQVGQQYGTWWLWIKLEQHWSK